MPEKKLAIKLTGDQQRQVKDATGKDLSELHIDLTATGNLSEKELERVAAGMHGSTQKAD